MNHKAIYKIHKNVVSVANDIAVDKNGDVVVLDIPAINIETDKIQAEYDAQEYARNRASAYDSVGNQLDMLMKDMRDGTTTHQTACEAVKTKYPKP